LSFRDLSWAERRFGIRFDFVYSKPNTRFETTRHAQGGSGFAGFFENAKKSWGAGTLSKPKFATPSLSERFMTVLFINGKRQGRRKPKPLLEKIRQTRSRPAHTVVSSGCSVWNTKSTETEAPQPKDKVTETQGLKVYVDPKASLPHRPPKLTTFFPHESGFKIKNPQSSRMFVRPSFTV